MRAIALAVLTASFILKTEMRRARGEEIEPDVKKFILGMFYTTVALIAVGV